MANVPTYRLTEWLWDAFTHPVVIEMCVRELIRRAECGRP